MAKETRKKRLMLSLTDTEFHQLSALAKVKNMPPAVVVREVLADYLTVHKADITEAVAAADAYHTSLEKLSRQTTLFPLDTS